MAWEGKESPSTAAPAMILPVRSLLGGGGLYDVALPGGAPVSPGSGWLLLNAPLSATRGYVLMNPLYLAVATLALWWAVGDRAAGGVVLVVLCSGFITWRLILSGHDIPAYSLALVAVLAVLNRARLTPALVLGVGVVLGTVVTCRAIWIALLPLYAVCLARRDVRSAVLLLIAGAVTAGVWHGGFYLTSDPYPPLHVFGRGSRNVGSLLMLAGAVCTVAAVVVLQGRLSRSFASWAGFIGVAVLVPMAFVAFGELRSVGFDLRQWEGANYLFQAVPLLSAAAGVYWGQCERSRGEEPGEALGTGGSEALGNRD